MGLKTLFVSLLVTVLGLIAASFGFVAEAGRARYPTLHLHFHDLEPPHANCDYPSSPSMGFAIAAVVFLVLVHAIIAITTGGCFSGCRVPNLPTFARVSIYMSWITSSVAIILFIIGAKLSNEHVVVVTESFHDYHCYVMPSGVFLIGAIIALLGVPLAPIYYLNYVTAIKQATNASRLELEVPPVADVKKPPVIDGKKPLKADAITLRNY